MSNQFSFNGLDYSNPNSFYSEYDYRAPVVRFNEGEAVRVTNPISTLPYPPYSPSTLPETFRGRAGTVRMVRDAGASGTFVFVDFLREEAAIINGVARPEMPATQLWFNADNVALTYPYQPPYTATVLNGEWVLTTAETNAGVNRLNPRRIAPGTPVIVRQRIPAGNDFVLWAASEPGVTFTAVENSPGEYTFTMPSEPVTVIAAFSGNETTTTPPPPTPPGSGSGSGSGTSQTVRVGDRVRVNNGVARWATGEAMPAWVHGRTYPVIEVRTRSGVNEVLLGEILSWIRLGDVTRV